MTRILVRLALCGIVFAGSGMAQRGGGGGGARGGGGGGMSRGAGGFTGGGISRGGGFSGGGMARSGGGFVGGGARIGGSGFVGGGSRIGGRTGIIGGSGGYIRGGLGGGFGSRGNFGFIGSRGGFIGSRGFDRDHRGFRGFGRGFSAFYYSPFLYSGLGWGYSYWPWYSSYYGYPYYGYPYYDYDYGYGYGYPASTYAYPAYQSSPVTVVYPPSTGETASTYQERPNPVIHEYDSYGQEITRPQAATSTSTPPIYLIAFHDQTIRAAEAYWVEGGTLHYVTLQHEQKQAPLGSVDRELSKRLNRERRVPFSLPETQ